MPRVISHQNENGGGSTLRFGFGENWQRFLSLVDQPRILEAEHSLKEMLDCETLQGKRFLDVGCGSGLFSLAAVRLGAEVTSFDYDRQCVDCTLQLKERYAPPQSSWAVQLGSILDASYVAALGTFDIVYSWGVLHHTGTMWRALESVTTLLKPGGRLCLAIYNDQGGASRRWAIIKRFYNRSPRPVQLLCVLAVGIFFELRSALIRLLRGQNPLPFKKRAKKRRGMSVWHDLVDWVGGYPFQVAKPEDIFDFYRQRGFTLRKLKTCGGGHGCNEFVFERNV